MPASCRSPSCSCRPGATVDAAELLAFVRERTPERAAVPVQLYFVDAIPLTAVGKVFKPALRLGRGRARGALACSPTWPQRGAGIRRRGRPRMPSTATLLTVRIAGVAAAERRRLQRQVDARLDPLTMRHAIVWS